MAREALAAGEEGGSAGCTDFLRDVRAEMKKVTWPALDELVKATIVIVIFVVVLGIVIGLLDSLLQLILVAGVARLFR